MDGSQPESHIQPVPKPLSPLKRVSLACREADIPALSSIIADCATSHGPGRPRALDHAVNSAIHNGNTYILRWLIDDQGANLDIEHISPSRLAQNPSPEFLQFFLDHGWDINTPGGLMHKQERIMQMLCSRNEDVFVPWCLARGAQVFSEEDLMNEPKYDPEVKPCPPILDSLVAGGGNVSNFQLLQKHGAKPGQRTLHLAVRRTAVVDGGGAHREEVGADQRTMNQPAAAAAAAAAWTMLKFLLENLGLDVNAKDTLTPMPGDYRGSPIAYAAEMGDGSEAVVKWLLEKGADPTVTDCWGHRDAIKTAEIAGGTRIAGMMRDWIAAREHERASGER